MRLLSNFNVIQSIIHIRGGGVFTPEELCSTATSIINFRKVSQYFSTFANPMFQADGDEFLTIAKEVNSAQTGSAKLEQLDDALIKQLSYVAAGDLAPLNAFIGGLAAQEVMKVSREYDLSCFQLSFESIYFVS